MPRPYESITASLKCVGDRNARMRTFTDTLWETLKDTGVSWVGFYEHHGDDELILGPSRDTPACSPIGMHGACGHAFISGKPLVVHDVRELGEGYVACDPRDQAEVVIPLIDETGRCWGVLDLDSHDVGAFDYTDVTGLTMALRAAGLTHCCPGD